MSPYDTIVKVLTDRLQSVQDVLRFSKHRVRYNSRDFEALDEIAEYEVKEQDLRQALRYIHEEQKVDKIIEQAFSEPDGNTQPAILLVRRLRDIADACEASGHKSRARMFRAVSKEVEDQFL